VFSTKQFPEKVLIRAHSSIKQMVKVLNQMLAYARKGKKEKSEVIQLVDDMAEWEMDFHGRRPEYMKPLDQVLMGLDSNMQLGKGGKLEYDQGAIRREEGTVQAVKKNGTVVVAPKAIIDAHKKSNIIVLPGFR